MPQADSRKGAAPRASSAAQEQELQQNLISASQTSNEGYRWLDQLNYTDSSVYSANIYDTDAISQAPYQQSVSATSTQLARIPGNRQMVSSARQPYDDGADPWGAHFGENTPLDLQASSNGVMEENDNIELLEEKAAIAKREAQAKRKQIPPFVQKLSSFLDISKNTDLIRWSDRGDSFIVLDEDEFAKTLIPELFKHNNYASFVRQLNMYGFHKRVGLSDNSMKASERKNKSPSEYYNPYFKRGHPNLLWLINKPKGGTGGKKVKGARVKTEENGEQSDEDVEVADDNYGQVYGQTSLQATTRAISAAPESGQLQRREISVVRDQLKEMQSVQASIQSAITRLKSDNHVLYQQARTFQTMHERHESSINAILTFLATIYKRGLDGQGNSQNLAQMFTTGIPQEQQRRQGDVVDIEDYASDGQQQQPPASPRRHQRLLLAPPLSRKAGGATVKSAASPNPVPTYSQPTPGHGSIEELIDSPSAKTFAPTKHEMDSARTPQQNIMSIINNTNAGRPNQGTGMEFPAVLSHYENANGNSPLTSEERNNMLKMIANSSPASLGINNALVTPTPPQTIFDQLDYAQAEIAQLAKIQEQQANKLNDVSALLQPMSPGGQVPGLNDGLLDGFAGNEYYDSMDSIDPNGATTSNLDLDQYLNTDDFYNTPENPNFNFGAGFENGGGDMDFDFDTTSNGQGGAGDVAGGGAADVEGSVREALGTSGSNAAETPSTGREEREATPVKRRRVA